MFENEVSRKDILRGVMLSEPGYTAILNESEKPDAFLTDYLAKISEQKRKLLSPEASDEHEPFPSIYSKYNNALHSQNAMDFDDILFFGYRILAENLEVGKLYNSIYKYICIDESQDLNEAQYRVIQVICGNNFRNIMMVGDENQSIYAFNGSSSKYMIEHFVRDFSPKICELDENFRSAKQIIKYANSLTNNEEDVSRYYYEGELNISDFLNEEEEAKSVRCKVEQLLLNKTHKDIEGNITHDKIAIIARNKYVFANVEEELRQANIPFYIKKTHSGIVCETDFMNAFDLILRLLVNPMDLFHKQQLCKMVGKKTSEFDCSENTIEMIEELLAESDYSWLSSVVAKINPNDMAGFDDALESAKNNMPQTLVDDDKYMLTKDINEWEKHWKQFKRNVPRENRSLVSFRNAIALGKTQTLDTDTGIALLTAHMSKGLEFEVVFIIGLTEGTFPDYRAVKSGGNAMEQEKNNMYVAVTRAKRLCYLSYPLVKKMPWGDDKKQDPSRFIDDYESNHI